MAVAVALGIGAGGYALADPPATQVDPATVPQGDLALKSHILTPFRLRVGHGREHVFPHGAEVTVEHDSLAAGANYGWHSHAGPVFVEIVAGTLTVYEKNDPTCTPHVYGVGTGFVEESGDIHDARNETAAATDFYAEYILPPGSGDAGLFQAASSSNSACPFPN